jgi:hypothetical protein
MPIFIVSLIIQLALIVHVLKTGRNTFWVFVLLFAPVIGGIAYFIVELLPELTNSRSGRQARRSVSKVINPDGDLKHASRQFAVADTVQNSIVLANQFLERSQYAEAKDILERSRKGVHADDPVILLLLAKSHFGLQDHAAVLKTLEELKTSNPSARSPEGHLLYARAQEESGKLDEAIHEYEALAQYFPGPEPRCRLATLLKQKGEDERARALFQEVVRESDIAGRHYSSLHKEWVSLARREVKN